MPFELDKLALESLNTEYRGQKLSLKHDPDAYTPATEKRIRAAVGDENSQYLAHIIAACVKEWNLTRHGEPVELTPEALTELGVKLLSHIHREILKSIFPPAQPETNSGSSF